MADVRSGYSDHIGFSLKAPGRPTLKMSSEPYGWIDDDLEIIRQLDHHGIFTQFTNSLKFYRDEFDYILSGYETSGVNADIFLIKNVLRESDGEVKMVQEYIGVADLKSIDIQNNYLSVNFNSNFLAEVLKSHETDEFEIEREDSIDGVFLPQLQLDKTEIKGRNITLSGESRLVNINGFSTFPSQEINLARTSTGGQFKTIKTELIIAGNARHSSVDLNSLTFIDSGFDTLSGDKASNMFFVDSVAEGELTDITVEHDIQLAFLTDQGLISNGGLRIKYYIVQWNLISSEYDVIETITLLDEQASTITKNKILQGSITKTLTFNQGMLLVYHHTGLATVGVNDTLYLTVFKQTLKVNTRTYFDGSVDITCIFVDKTIERLLNIITGRSNILVSKYFGRVEDGYAEDGEAGLVALIQGFWYRAFDPDSDKYKSLTISLKNLINSLNSVFNIGMGINYDNFEEIVRVENKSFFYQDKVVVKLGQLQKISRKLDDKLFFSGLEFGYEDGGDYENEIGLDEPNTRTSYVTPIRKSTQKYLQVSKIRSDEYGAEKLRRFPQELHPDDDTAQDKGIWFNDLKRTEGSSYTQKDWEDRLVAEPTGVLSPETYRSFWFTPLQMLKRHGWIIRSGMEQYYNKYIKPISLKANSNLSTHFIGETQPVAENQDIQVNYLERSKMTPWVTTGEYGIDDTLWKLITGTTSVLINGSYEEVPNYYFKFEWIDDNDETKRGYLLELKGKGVGKFKLQEVNESIIL